VRRSRGRGLVVLGTALVLLGVSLTVLLRPGADGVGDDRVVDAASHRGSAPSVGHVFVINLENKSFRTTWGAQSAAPYLARTLRGQGVLLSHYFATAHHSLPDYVAQVSGQGPSPATQADCGRYTVFRTTGPAVKPQQAVGNGCVYPRSVKTIGDQLSAQGLGWRAYLEDMTRPCQHPALGASDPWHKATSTSQYATRHNPFVYFRSITSRAAYCKSHDVPLTELAGDLQKTSTTRALTYITPDLCHDAHDRTCADGGPGGLRAANAFLKRWVPLIRRSPAYQADGMLVITSDESEGSAAACCGEGAGPNVAKPGITGMGGGRVGALVLSPSVTAGAVSATPYNHYSLLATLEDLFGLTRLGYARRATAFVPDVFTVR
jgi:phosphatidylinositol-3-phosphatase